MILVFFPLLNPASPIIVENISPWVCYLENEDYTQFCEPFVFGISPYVLYNEGSFWLG